MKCISLPRLRIFPLPLGWVGVHSTRPLVRLVPIEYHLSHWYSIGEMHLIMRTWNISVGFGLSVHPTRPLVRLVPMEQHLFHWYSIGEMNLITWTSVGFRLSMRAFYRASDISRGHGAVNFNLIREIQQNSQNTRNLTKFARNLTKYMTAQHIWKLSWLLGLLTHCKLANLPWNFITTASKQHPKITRRS